MRNFIVCGMQFGDEGKGSFVDYLAKEQNIDCDIRYNGGIQDSRIAVTSLGDEYKFSQLGAGMFSEKCHTYITENVVVNLYSLMNELKQFSYKTGIPLSELMDRVHIHEDCFVVTPYHKLINRFRELLKKSDRIGATDTGASEVRYLADTESLGLQVKDIFNTDEENLVVKRLEELQRYATKLYRDNEETIWKNIPEEFQESLLMQIEIFLEPLAFFKVAVMYMNSIKEVTPKHNLVKCLYNSYELEIRKKYDSAIFEGSQGLLVDGTYGIKPHTTFLDGTNEFALDISYYRDDITKIGVAKAFISRDGFGVLPTEDEKIKSKVSGENEQESFGNGRTRFGWFDAVLMRYAQKINQVDELYLSCLDQLSDFEIIKFCSSYYYSGTVNERLGDLFEYFITDDGRIIITDIKESAEDISQYLEKCFPKYWGVEGWQSDISNVSEKNQLPDKCLHYIAFIENFIKVPITVVSVGPNRENKIRLN